MAESDTPDVPPIPVPPIEPAPKAKAPAKPVTSQIGKSAAAKPTTSQIGKTDAAKPATAKAAATKPAAAKADKPPVAAPAAAAERPNPYAQAAPAPAAPQPYSNGPYVAPPSQGLSITSMVLGIVGVFFSFCYGLGFLFAAAGVVTGHIAQRKEKHAKPFWLTGIITGYAGIGIALLWLLFGIGFAIWAGTLSNSYYDYGY